MRWGVNWLGKGVRGRRNLLNQIDLMIGRIVIYVLKNLKGRARRERLRIGMIRGFGG